MLVVTRKVGERILIGDDIVVTVVDIRGDNIRLGIEAPRSLRVERSERLDWVADETRAATQATPSDEAALVNFLTDTDDADDSTSE